MADTPGIVARGLRRSFGDVHAVSDATFEAPAGRVTALVGPNGSGKTTLLLMLASLLRPDAGSVRIAGADPVEGAADVRARIGWMPDALGAWPSLTARETLIVTGRLYRLPRERAAARAAELLGLVGLVDLADRPARVLSRGQKQRLGLARALVHDPAVLLLDEPASGLDPQARIELRVLLRGLAADGRTILVSSHVLSELEEIADGAVYMVKGATVADDRVARAGSGTRDWRIRFLPGRDPAASGEFVSALVGAGVDVSTVRRDRSDLVVPLASDETAAACLASLVAAGLPVVEFAPVTGRLEQTFLGLGTPEDRAS
ncbi:ABC transporter ATP-binding protein [Microbacterium sp.]|uniref:ABC transporter ATP-binding protein n=1 Tax=Microbacterium sp. TaxID=51671 RepID=UPI002811F8D6|nr:ABC transporter ATP-binding protein [Microbacterium sp.]